MSSDADHGKELASRQALWSVIRHTKAVIGERLDDAAVADTTMPTLVNHPSEFELKSLKSLDAVFDLAQVVSGNAVGLVARRLRLGGHGQKRTDILNFESELAGMSDEVEAADLGGAVTPLASLGPWRRREKSNLLIEADGRHLNGSAAR